MPIRKISSSDLIPVEENFRISAGPGAGKTFWLINHIKNVIGNSNRLGGLKKIACITYTNAAVEILKSRIIGADEKVEFSTIHSFLYCHVVKPYIAFIPNEYGLDIQKVDGHDDRIISNYSFINEWITKTDQKRITVHEYHLVVEAISKASWKFNDKGELTFEPLHPYRIGKYAIKTASYYEYKKMAWTKGFLHHEDVLFFSYQLIKNEPFILNALRAKFPYFFIDEFQDTNPIQTKIIEKIGEEETKIGIIGDKVQSIYGFIGAQPNNFNQIKIPNILNYYIPENFRSSREIIDLLNLIRSDIRQTCLRNVNGVNPTLYVGESVKFVEKIKETFGNVGWVCLCRNNDLVNTIKYNLDKSIVAKNILAEFLKIENNNDRKKIILQFIRAILFTIDKNYKEAIKEISKAKLNYTDISYQIDTFWQLNKLLNDYPQYIESNLLEFHSLLAEKYNIKLAKFTKKSPIKVFYENTKFKEMISILNVEDGNGNGLIRTIHKAKGCEFDTVCLALKEEKDLDFLLKTDLKNEEHRIYYVALSRARDNLFINIPSLSDDNKEVIKSMKIELVFL